MAELGLSVREVAKHLGVSSPGVTAIEAGTNHNDVSLAHLLRVAAVVARRADHPARRRDGGEAS